MDFGIIVAPVVLWICISGVNKLAELYVRRKERLAIIDKFGERFDPSLLGNPFGFASGGTSHSFGALRAGCLLLGLGLGFLTGLLLSTLLIANGYNTEEWHYREILFNAAYVSPVLLFGGLGLLLSFLIENKIRNKNKQG